MSKCWHQPKRVVLTEGSQHFCFANEDKYTLNKWGPECAITCSRHASDYFVPDECNRHTEVKRNKYCIGYFHLSKTSPHLKCELNFA